MEQIPLPKSFKCIKEDGNESVFVLEPLYPGYGVTMGNSLRRILLSSLPGAAVTAVKVKGVDHEFSTIPNVKEDMVEIILNLKQLQLKSHSVEPVRIVLKAKGGKEVTAGMIEKNDQVEVMNPDLHIATLDGKGAEFELEMVIEQGRGYVPVESREEERLEIGMIAVDAIYSPVRTVSYEVENVRVGKITNFDKLTITITTDGTVDGGSALHQAALIAVDHFKVLLQEQNDEEQQTQAQAEGSPAKEESQEPQSSQESDLLALNLSRRAYNALVKNDIKTVKRLLEITEDDLQTMQGLGEKSVKEILETVKSIKGS